MKPVPYFDRFVDPGQFRHGYGLRGWLIVALAWVYAFAERWIQLLVLRAELVEQSTPRARLRALMETAKGDPTFNPEEHHPVAVKVARVTLRSKLGLEAPDRSAKYAEGRAAGPLRPIPADEGLKFTFARYSQKSDRSARYVGARGSLSVYEPEEENAP